jgi:hypothetical protein
LVYGFSTCSWWQLVVPSGGKETGSNGCKDGGSIGQTLGGHIGGKSSEPLHKGWFSPFMQVHTQEAKEGYAKIINIEVSINNVFIKLRLIC